VVPGKAEIADQRLEPFETSDVLVPRVLGKLDQQHRIGIAAHDGVDGRAEHVDRARKLDHGAVDQLDRDGLELDDVLGRIHGVVEAAEMAGADSTPTEQRPQLELDPGGKAERPLGADEQLGEIVDRRVGGERVEIVAADPPLHLGKALGDLVGFAHRDGKEVLRQRPQR